MQVSVHSFKGICLFPDVSWSAGLWLWECLGPAASHSPLAVDNQDDQMMNWSELGLLWDSLFFLSFFWRFPLAASLAEIRSLIPGFSISALNLIFGPQVPSPGECPRSCCFPISSGLHARSMSLNVKLCSSVLGLGTAFEFYLYCLRLTFLTFAVFFSIISYPSWPIPIAQTQSSYSLEILGNKALTWRLFHCLTQSLGTVFDLGTYLTLESDISHKFIKCPGDHDLDHWPNSSVLDSRSKPALLGWLCTPHLSATGSILPHRGGMSATPGANKLWEKDMALSHHISRVTVCSSLPGIVPVYVCCSGVIINRASINVLIWIKSCMVTLHFSSEKWG